MKTIWKYSLPISGHPYSLTMPEGAEVLHVAWRENDGGLCLWVMLDTSRPSTGRYFVVVGTGHPMPGGEWEYVGTAFMDSFVWHVFVGAPVW